MGYYSDVSLVLKKDDFPDFKPFLPYAKATTSPMPMTSRRSRVGTERTGFN